MFAAKTRWTARPREQALLRWVAVEAVRPAKLTLRQAEADDSLAALAADLRRQGVLTPLWVRQEPDGGLRLIAGSRRLQAAKLAGLRQVPCLVLTVDEATAACLTLTENLHRRPLSDREEAEALHRLMDLSGLSVEDCALRLGRAPAALRDKLRLLEWGAEARRRIERAGLTAGQALCLLSLPPDEREAALDTVIARALSPRETAALVTRLLQPPPPTRPPVFRDLRLFDNTVERSVELLRRAGLQATVSRQEGPRALCWQITVERPDAAPAEDAPVPAETGGQLALDGFAAFVSQKPAG